MDIQTAKKIKIADYSAQFGIFSRQATGYQPMAYKSPLREERSLVQGKYRRKPMV